MRALTPADAEAAAALIRTAFAAQPVRTDPPSAALRETAESVAARVAAGGGAAVERGGAMVGVILWTERDGLYLGRLAVLPQARGQGIARALVAAAEAEAVRRGLSRIHLGARLSLPGNRRFFAACGYIEAGLETHPGYDAPTSVVMEKHLR